MKTNFLILLLVQLHLGLSSEGMGTETTADFEGSRLLLTYY